jgi:hypothetical protein
MRAAPFSLVIILLNKYYEPVAGYSSLPRTVAAGLRVSL